MRALEERIEKKLGSHDRAIAGLIETLRRLMAPGHRLHEYEFAGELGLS